MIHLLLEKIENYLTLAPEGRDIITRVSELQSNAPMSIWVRTESLALVGGNQIRVMTCGLCNVYRDYDLKVSTFRNNRPLLDLTNKINQ